MRMIEGRSLRFGRLAQRGVAAVEFALILPVLLLIVFGIINFGLLMYDLSVVTNAAREGARWQAMSTNYTKTGNSKGYTVGDTTCGTTKVGSPTLPQHVVCNYLIDVPLINLGAGGSPKVAVTGSSTLATVTVKFDFGWLGYIPFVDFTDKPVSATMYYEP